MEEYDIYQDIATRTRGDIYIGVVGPVRTGKSTFIKGFMERLVLPNISDNYIRERTIDELPQSADGTAIMTTEPKFVPNEAVEIVVKDNVAMRVRLIDCVGYVVEGATGHRLENGPRMVSTPWSSEKMPFVKAAEMGTKKVITDHSTMCIVVTTDGTVTDLPRESYALPEGQIVNQLKETGKPFVIVLNTAVPSEAGGTVAELEKKYSVPVLPINCKEMAIEDIDKILEKSLYQFPIVQVDIHLPKWVETLELSHWLKSSLITAVKEFSKAITGFNSIDDALTVFAENPNVKKSYSENIDLASGVAGVELALEDNLFYNVLSETTDMDIESEYQLIATMKQLAQAKREYDKIKFALDEVNRKGYGIVTADSEDMKLKKPECVKQGNRYGISITANSPCIHLIKSDVNTSVATVVGTEEQSKELVNYLSSQYGGTMENVWGYEIFGRTLKELMNDDLNSKLMRISEDTQGKLQDTLEKIINTGHGGIICILL